LTGELVGERLSRVPKGYPADHPAADLLRFKQLYFFAELPAEIAVTPAVLGEIVSRFRALAPFMEFMNAPLAAEMKKARFRL
jgi:hypothetical protein